MKQTKKKPTRYVRNKKNTKVSRTSCPICGKGRWVTNMYAYLTRVTPRMCRICSSHIYAIKANAKKTKIIKSGQMVCTKCQSVSQYGKGYKNLWNSLNKGKKYVCPECSIQEAKDNYQAECIKETAFIETLEIIPDMANLKDMRKKVKFNGCVLENTGVLISEGAFSTRCEKYLLCEKRKQCNDYVADELLWDGFTSDCNGFIRREGENSALVNG